MNDMAKKFNDSMQKNIKATEELKNKSALNFGEVNKLFIKYLGPAALAGGFIYAISQSAEAEKALNSLKSAVEISGGAWEKLAQPMQEYAQQLAESTTFTDEEVMDVMQRLITVTGDNEKGWKSASLALDMASTGMISVEGAAKGISMAMEGNVEALGRLIPELKGINLKHLEGASAAQKSAYAMELLQEKFGGRAMAEVNTYAGQFKQFKKNIDELAEGIGDLLLPALTSLISNANEAIKTLTKLFSVNKSGIGELSETGKKLAIKSAEAIVDAAKKSQDLMSAETKKALKETIEFNKDTLEKLTGMRVKNATDAEIILAQLTKKYTKETKTSTDYSIKSEKEKQEQIIDYWEDEWQMKRSIMAVTEKDHLNHLKIMLNDKRLNAESRRKIEENIAKLQGDIYQEDLKKSEEIKNKKIEYYNELAKSFNEDLVEKIITGNIDIGDSFMALTVKMSTDWLVNFIEPAGNAVVSLIDQLLTNPTSLFSALQQLVSPIWSITMELTSSIEGGIMGVLGIIKQIWDSLSGLVSQTWNIGVNVAQSAIGAITGGGGILGGAAKGAAIGSVLGPIGSAVGGILGGVASFFGFQEGGIVNKPTLGLIGEAGPEAVVPLKKAGDIGQTIININVNGGLLGNRQEAQEFAKVIDKQLEILRRTNQSVAFAY
jgi:hypothetical protein